MVLMVPVNVINNIPARSYRKVTFRASTSRRNLNVISVILVQLLKETLDHTKRRLILQWNQNLKTLPSSFHQPSSMEDSEISTAWL